MSAFTRRDLLRAGTATLAGGLPEAAFAQNPPGSTPPAEVLVLGAGVAGLRAAQQLRRKNLYVTVLEARERIGGRLWTDRTWENAPLDLGASWIHGVTGNPLTSLALELRLKTLPTRYDAMTLYDAQGKPLPEKRRDAIERRVEDFTRSLSRLRDSRRRLNQPDVSLRFALNRYLQTQPFTDAESAELRFALNTVVEHEYAADLSQLSLYHWDSDEAFDGGDVVFPEGYDQILKPMTEGLDIRLGQIVRKVAYDGQGVTVTTQKGEFKAKRALIALPLGVLQRNAVLFSPALPERKRAAIRNLGMGVLNKTFLLFPKAFWEEKSQGWGYLGEEVGAWSEFFNFTPVVGKPALLGFNAGDYGYYIEGLTDAQIIGEAMGVLRKLFGASIPDPVATRITRWASDPFACGSYSYLPPGASGEDRDALEAPAENRLFFAGEATHRQHPSTVHGALLSGERAAKRILAL